MAWNLFWPTPFAFVTQIVLFYPAFYLIKTARSGKLEAGVMLGLTATYLTAAIMNYNIHMLSCLFYFQLMLLGGVWAGRIKQMGRTWRRHLAVLGVTMLVYVGVKLGMVTGRIPTNVVPLHRLSIVIVYSLLELTATAPVQSASRLPRLGPALGLLASLTFEVYLVHGLVYESPYVVSLPFPVNIVVFWMATLPLAWGLSAASSRLRPGGEPGKERGCRVISPPLVAPENSLNTSGIGTRV